MNRRLGRYELHDVLGTGGFATVYRATDPSLDAVVAVKVLADNWSRDPDVRRRFRAEAVLLRRVQAGGAVHGLVEVHDIDEDDAGQPFFVMGYADRGTLATRSG
ncbi:MAG: serine/threonine protein kinase, partial [Actinomycetota bacterium]|nr:serine/threonine protein kinase [Actinomycetota bacterium]